MLAAPAPTLRAARRDRTSRTSGSISRRRTISCACATSPGLSALGDRGQLHAVSASSHGDESRAGRARLQRRRQRLVHPGAAPPARDRWRRSDDVRVIAVRYPVSRGALPGRRRRRDRRRRRGPQRRGTLDVWRRTLRVLRDEHRRRPFDVLHAFWATESGLLAAIAGRLLGIPTLVSLAGGELVGSARHRLRRPARRLGATEDPRQPAAGIGGVGRLARTWRRWPGDTSRPPRLHRAPLGVDLDLFTPPASPARGASTLRARRHADRGQGPGDAAARVRSAAPDVPCATLDIVGDGPLRTRPRATCRRARDRRRSPLPR